MSWKARTIYFCYFILFIGPFVVDKNEIYFLATGFPCKRLKKYYVVWQESEGFCEWFMHENGDHFSLSRALGIKKAKNWDKHTKISLVLGTEMRKKFAFRT